eukprot:symbB.v1.2.036973.t1/scaffold5346.1/size28234/1
MVTRPKSTMIALHTACVSLPWPEWRLEIIEKWLMVRLPAKKAATRGGHDLLYLPPAKQDVSWPKLHTFVRGFSALVRLDYYNPRLIHGRICAGLSLKFDELLQGGRAGPPAFARPQQAARGFNALAELLHCLSLLPAQSHKSMELTTTTSQSMTQLLGQLLSLHQEDLERRGATAKDATASVGRLPDPHAVATAAVAVAQLGRVEQEEELMKCLVQCVTGAKNPGFLALASEEELKELQGAFELCNAMEVQEVIAAELQRRPMDVDRLQKSLDPCPESRQVWRISTSSQLSWPKMFIEFRCPCQRSVPPPRITTRPWYASLSRSTRASRTM